MFNLFFTKEEIDKIIDVINTGTKLFNLRSLIDKDYAQGGSTAQVDFCYQFCGSGSNDDAGCGPYENSDTARRNQYNFILADLRRILSGALLKVLYNQTSDYASRLDNLFSFNRISETDYQGCEWFWNIQWDLIGIKLLIALDLIWDDLSIPIQDAAKDFIEKIATNIWKNHEKEAFSGGSGGAKAENKTYTGNNIKSWDNSFLLMAGFFLKEVGGTDPIEADENIDDDLISYALDSDNNKALIGGNGAEIKLNMMHQLRNFVFVNEPVVIHGDNRYGKYKNVDCTRVNPCKDRDGDPPPDWEPPKLSEAIGYPLYHIKALSVGLKVLKNKLGIDLVNTVFRAEQNSPQDTEPQERNRLYKHLHRLFRFIQATIKEDITGALTGIPIEYNLIKSCEWDTGVEYFSQQDIDRARAALIDAAWVIDAANIDLTASGWDDGDEEYSPDGNSVNSFNFAREELDELTETMDTDYSIDEAHLLNRAWALARPNALFGSYFPNPKGSIRGRIQTSIRKLSKPTISLFQLNPSNFKLLDGIEKVIEVDSSGGFEADFLPYGTYILCCKEETKIRDFTKVTNTNPNPKIEYYNHRILSELIVISAGNSDIELNDIEIRMGRFFVKPDSSLYLDLIQWLSGENGDQFVYEHSLIKRKVKNLYYHDNVETSTPNFEDTQVPYSIYSDKTWFDEELQNQIFRYYIKDKDGTQAEVTETGEQYYFKSEFYPIGHPGVGGNSELSKEDFYKVKFRTTYPGEGAPRMGIKLPSNDTEYLLCFWSNKDLLTGKYWVTFNRYSFLPQA